MENINLLGTEDVLRASRNMQNAATDMINAHSYFEESLTRHRQFLDDWLNRFETVLKDEGEKFREGINKDERV